MIRHLLLLTTFLIGCPFAQSFNVIAPKLVCVAPSSKSPLFDSSNAKKSLTCLPASKLEEEPKSIRSSLRELTGFSLTAMRATMRASTGISLTAISASARATTSIYVTKIMKWCLQIFPTWLRYFAQPFLMFYYLPLLLLRSMGPKARFETRHRLETQMDEWRSAVRAASASNEEWPVFVNEEGYILGTDETIDVAAGVLESVLWQQSTQP